MSNDNKILNGFGDGDIQQNRCICFNVYLIGWWGHQCTNVEYDYYCVK